jgi:4-amino-4-deoxy-L-arabinose transferase-like glycosyltransferase
VSVRLVAALQVVALVVLGAVTVARFHVFAEIDERQHYDVVQKFAEDQRLPRPTDLVSRQTQAIDEGTWPRPSPRDRARIGLGGRSYEAIQPPLYYLTAVPAFLLVADHRDKVFAVRAFDLLLVVVALALVWRLARRVAPAADALPAVAVALAVALWPGLVVRGVTIGNTPLELVLVAAFLLVLWRADREPRRWRPAVLAAVVLGLCLLTKLTLVYLVPLFAVVLWRRRGRLVPSLAVALLPLVMLAPWLALNQARYGSLTVNLAGSGGVLGEGVGGTGVWDRVADLPSLNARLVDGVLAQEFRFQLDVWWVKGLVVVLLAGLAVAALAALARHPRDWRLWFLCLPALSGWAVMNLVYVVNASDQFLLRYLYGALLPLAVGVGLAIPREHRRTVALVASLAAAALWVDMAGAFYFTDVGDALGI